MWKLPDIEFHGILYTTIFLLQLPDQSPNFFHLKGVCTQSQCQESAENAQLFTILQVLDSCIKILCHVISEIFRIEVHWLAQKSQYRPLLLLQ